MVWLLCGLLLLGVALLLAVLIPLLRRLRNNQVEIAALRITLGEESARLRTGQELLRAWRHGRG
jgi:hypothetical protein